MGNVLSSRLNEGHHKKRKVLWTMIWLGVRAGAVLPTLHYTRQTYNPQRSSPRMFYLRTALTFAKHSGKYVVRQKEKYESKE
jgi:hypothetical protein